MRVCCGVEFAGCKLSFVLVICVLHLRKSTAPHSWRQAGTCVGSGRGVAFQNSQQNLCVQLWNKYRLDYDSDIMTLMTDYDYDYDYDSDYDYDYESMSMTRL